MRPAPPTQGSAAQQPGAAGGSPSYNHNYDSRATNVSQLASVATQGSSIQQSSPMLGDATTYVPNTARRGGGKGWREAAAAFCAPGFQGVQQVSCSVLTQRAPVLGALQIKRRSCEAGRASHLSSPAATTRGGPPRTAAWSQLCACQSPGARLRTGGMRVGGKVRATDFNSTMRSMTPA